MKDLEKKTLDLMEEKLHEEREGLREAFKVPDGEPFDLTEEESNRLIDRALTLAKKCVAGNAPDDELLAGLMYLMICKDAFEYRLNYRQVEENLDIDEYLEPKYKDIPID